MANGELFLVLTAHEFADVAAGRATAATVYAGRVTTWSHRLWHRARRERLQRREAPGPAQGCLRLRPLLVLRPAVCSDCHVNAGENLSVIRLFRHACLNERATAWMTPAALFIPFL